MTQHFAHSRDFIVTSLAADKLMALRTEHKKPLRFRVYVDEDGKFNLRVHDKEYRGDWTIDMNGIGISFCQLTLGHGQLLVLDYRDYSGNDCGFEFVLQSGKDVVSQLDGDDAIARIISSEVEVCDTYGEYCYSTYS